MKRIFTTLSIFIFFLITVKAQNPHPFELGFNAGAAWQKSDVKTGKLGGGLGLTFGQTYCMNQTSPLLWGWRFRYLNANTYGQDSKKSFGIANNNVLNGSDTTLDYYNNGGFVYHNYKTHIDELSVELLLGANKIRERTNLYPYIFAGAGITKAVAKINQLDGNNQRYNYLKVDSAGTASGSEVLSGLNDISDGTYETLADGNQKPSWKFMPSVGVGIGYEIIKGFSIGLEHKATWALNDVLDGQRWNSNNVATGNNDMYHYTSFFLKFSFGRGAKGTSNASTTTPTDNTTLNPVTIAPAVSFTNPPSSPFGTSAPNMTVTGKVTNINSVSDMSMTVNGNAVSGFTYNPSTDMFSFPMSLQNGNNTIVVTGTNSSGSGNATTTIIYTQAVAPVEKTPLVNIAVPSSSPFTSTQASVTVSGTVMNISDRSQMQIMMNGASVTNFTYNNSSRTFSTSQTLIPGANTFVVSATNSAGSDSKSVTVIYQPVQAPSTPAPVVTIINPAVNPYTSAVSPLPVNASIMNITAVGQIEVTVNGGPVPSSKLSYNTSSHQLSFNAVLVAGANTVEVSATNVAGRDSKTTTVIYNQPQVAMPPQVTITNPSVNPFNTTNASCVINASILNISSAGQISVTLNGGPVPTSALNYSSATHQLTFNVNLIQGANTVVVSASNAGGNDSKTATIIYTQPVQIPAPVVTITSPAVNPFNTPSSSAILNASVLNVSNAGQIAATLNGVPVPAGSLSFNAASHLLTFNVTLIQGANTVMVSATNTAGSDSKTITIIYTQPLQVPPPVVTIINPGTNPFNTSSGSASVTASVLNVTAVGQISVTLNGGPVMSSALTFNPGTHQLSFNVNLIQGANTISVSATNLSGTDSKTQTIIYTQAVQSPPPVITISNPSTSPYTITASSAPVTATIMNVTSAAQISVMLNGAVLPAGSWNYNISSHQLTFTAALIQGANTIVISASNSTGSDSKTQIINSKKVIQLQLPAPVITITNPGTNPFTSSSSVAAVTATALNVNSSSEVTVKINGTPTTAFSFNNITKQIAFSANLVAGTNTILISATNAGGSDSKTQTINYEVPPAPPVVTYLTPASGSATVTSATYVISATATNISTSSQISIKLNGNPVVSFMFQASTKKIGFTAGLNPGVNKVVITATNSSGTDTKTALITRNDVVAPTDPVKPDTATGTPLVIEDGVTISRGKPAVIGTSPQIVLLIPATNTVTTTNALYMLKMKTVNVPNIASITVKINGVGFSGFTWDSTNQLLGIPAALNMGMNSVVVLVTNAGVTKTEVFNITRQ
jgi:hypothetical protein